MTLRRLSLITFSVAGWALAGILAVLVFTLVNRSFDDSITLAGRHTDELLALHARSDQTREVLAWLTQYHGEAPNHQVMISFIQWASDNTESAEALLEPLQADSAITSRLAFAVTDSCMHKMFHDAFGKSGSSAVKAIIAEVDHLQPPGTSSGCG